MRFGRFVAAVVTLTLLSSSLAGVTGVASATTINLSTPTATYSSFNEYNVTPPQGAVVPTLAMSAVLQAVLPSVVYVDGTAVSQQTPEAGQTIHFGVQSSDGVWWPVCDAVTNSDGTAWCDAPEPHGGDQQGNPVYPIFSAWSAVYSGGNGAPLFLSPSADYGRIPGSPVPAPTPPGNGSVTFVPKTYQNGCPAPDPSQLATLGTLLTDGGNCQLVSMEKYATMAVFELAPLVAGFGIVVAQIGQIVALAGRAAIEASLGIIGSATATIVAGVARITQIALTALIFEAGSALVDYGVLSTSAPLNVPLRGTWKLGGGTTINNSNVITNDGVIADADADNQGAGTLNNTGTIINHGTIPNGGQGAGGLLITGNNYTLNFDAGASPGVGPSPLQVFARTVADSQQALPTPEPPIGDTFVGWFTDDSGGTKVTDSTDLSVLLPTGPSSATLHARFVPSGALATATTATAVGTSYSSSGNAVALSAQVISAAGAVGEGTVTFTVSDGFGNQVGAPVTAPVGEGTASVSYPLPAGLAVGSYVAQATYSDAAGGFGFEGSDGTHALSVSPAPTTTVGGPASIDYTGQAAQVTESAQVTSAAGTLNEGAVTFTLQDGSGQAVASTGQVSGGTASAVLSIPAGLPPGTYSVIGSYGDPQGNFAASSDFVGGLQPQTINVPGSPPVAEVVGNTWNVPFPYSPSTGNGGTWSLDPASTGCAYNGALTFTAVGTCILDATVPASPGYAEATAVFSFPVGPALDRYTSNPFPVSATVGSTFPISATSPSGAPVDLTIDPSASQVCSLANDVVTFLALGDCLVDFTTATTPEYVGYTETSPVIPVVPEQTSIQFSTPPASAAVGDAYQVAALATSGGTVGLTVDPSSAAVCSLSAGTVAFTGIGTCLIDGSAPATGSYAQAAAQQSVAVGPEAQTISFSATPTVAVVGGTYAVSATSGSGEPVSVTVDPSSAAVCSLSAGTVTFTRVGTCLINGSAPATGNYAQATAQQSVAVGRATTPKVTAVSPGVGPTSGGTTITITGSGFATGDRVVIGQGHGAGAAAIAATQVVVLSSTEVTAVTGGQARVGAWTVFVLGPGNRVSAKVKAAVFTYQPAVAPSITTVSPNSGPTAGGTSIEITGTGFAAGDRVTVGLGASAVPATQVAVVTPTEITAVTGTATRSGTLNVSVIDPNGRHSSIVSGDLFHYQG